MTLKDYMSMVAIKIEDIDMTRIPPDLIKSLVNLHRVTVAVHAHPQRLREEWYTTSVVANNGVYDLGDIGGTDEDLALDLLEITYDGNTLDLWTLKDKNRQDDGWYNPSTGVTTAKGTPQDAVVDGRVLLLDPPPDTDGKIIGVFIYAKPADLTSESDKETQIPKEYQSYVWQLAVADIKNDAKELTRLKAELEAMHRKEVAKVKIKSQMSIDRTGSQYYMR